MTGMRLGLSHLCDLKLEKLSEHTNIFLKILYPKLKRQHNIYTIVLHIELKRLPS